MTVVDRLLNRGILSSDQLDEAREKKGEMNCSLVETLAKLKFVDEYNLTKAISETLELPIQDLNDINVDLDTLTLIPDHFVKQHNVLPIKVEDGDILVVAMGDPTNVFLLDNLQVLTSLSIKPILTAPSQISKKIEKYFVGDTLETALNRVNQCPDMYSSLDSDSQNLIPSILNDNDSPVIQLVNNIISNAVKENASDIHIEPLEACVELRYRIDGELKVKMKIPSKIQRYVASRIKIMSHLDISECRRPQDGRIEVKILDRNVDLRVSTMPVVFGEKIVMRILDATDAQVDINNLGFDDKKLKTFKRLVKQPQGMVLVTGPTGAGKTSTLYAALNTVKDSRINIMTIEDPVEYVMEGVNQIQVNEKIGVTFGSGLRAMLRQDPDIILVGEIRDKDTAEIAFRSAMTGHLVLSTLHTTGSIPSITRLRNIGIEPFLISSSLLGIVAQRLIRLSCTKCKEAYTPDLSVLHKFDSYLTNKKMTWYRGRGCEECDYSGFKGRKAIFEILTFNTDIRRLINANAAEDEILKHAKKTGFRTLVEEGIAAAQEGLTTLEQIEKIVGHGDDIEDEIDFSEFRKKHPQAERQASDIEEEMNMEENDEPRRRKKNRVSQKLKAAR